MEVRTNGLQAVNPVQAEVETRPEEAVTSTGLVSVVVPTRNERSNMAPLLARLAALRENHRLEVIVVDDSDDGTAEAAEYAAVLLGLGAGEWTVVHRPPPRRVGGLSGAVVEGLGLASGEWVVVMDGDLQHPPEAIDEMLALAAEQNAGLVVAVRRDAEHGYDSLSPVRRTISRTFRSTARVVLPRLIGELSDPMSGFFMVRRDALDVGRLRPQGFKILLEVVATHPELRVAEMPFAFGSRLSGESKANAGQAFAYARQLRALSSQGRRATRTGYSYQIHGLFSIRSEQALPELEKFLVDRLGKPADLVVEVGGLLKVPPGETIDLAQQPATVSYRERAGFAVDLIPYGTSTTVRVSKSVARSPHVLYTNVVEPILRWRLVERDHVLVHAACFADEDRGYLITARTDTGKTTTMLKVLERAPYGFLSDDLTLLSPQGEILCYPKPLTISQHTVHALRQTDLNRKERLGLKVQSRLHSREGRQFAFLLTKYRLPVASINAWIQRLVPPPKYHVERLVLGVQHATSAVAAGLVIIQRGGVGEERLPTSEALEILTENCDDAYGFPPYTTLERLLHALSDEDLRAKERRLMNEALGRHPAIVLRSDTLDWAERIPDVLSEWADI